MGAVSQHLIGLLKRQVEEHGLVVWFDPEGHYTDLAADLTLPDIAVEIYDGSFFELRHRLEPHLGAPGDAPPRLLVYVPLGEEETHNALVELTEPGVVLRPGSHSSKRNTRLAAVARAALRPILGRKELDEAEQKTRAVLLTLADLDRLGGIGSNVLSVIFDISHPHDVALKFLASADHDAAIQEKQAMPDLLQRFGDTFGFEHASEGSCAAVRDALARHLLMTEFALSLSGPLPPDLSSVPTADGEEGEACASLVHEWRNRLDLRESYANHADRVEQEMGLRRKALDLDQIRGCHTFSAVESALQTAVENLTLDDRDRDEEDHRSIMALIEERLHGFWSSWPDRYPEVQPRWRLIQAAVEVIHTAHRVEEELKRITVGPEEILRRYAGSPEDAWCDLDAHHRRFEVRDFNFYRSDTAHETLERLVVRARQRYMTAANLLSEHFLGALRENRFEMPGLQPQLSTFSRYVEPHLKDDKKTAYVLIDSLRYEMARELSREMEDDHGAELSVAVGTVPTITEIGMAALMPGAESGARVVPVAQGRLGLEVAGTVLRDRKGRLDHLKKWSDEASLKLYVTRLESLYTSTKKSRVGAAVRDADLVLVTSQEIDEQGESGGGPTARLFMDEVLRRIPRAITALADLGCERIVIASDHGYIFADELDSDTKIDPPGGETSDLHRRVWVGVGGSEDPSFFRVPLSRMGLSDDLEVAVPWGLGAFRVPGGASAYFHGGMSPQELAIPVLALTSKQTAASPEPSADIDWDIRLGARTISTRVISVRVGGRSASLLDPTLPRCRLEVRVGDNVVSEPMVAAYDYSETAQDFGLALQEDGKIDDNAVTLVVDPDAHPEAREGMASVHLLDSTTGRTLASLDGVEVSISV
ncbi:MAG: PglZ domain-containing protein [Rubrobacteraceae bacterium]|nr:PglZ domain-containing protein [Rubrobacteraceae bacterium]